MTTTLFDIHPTTASRIDSVDLSNPVFGSVFSDHQFRMDFEGGEWKTGVIEPYADMSISPAAMVFHYGQSIFEGMKAFRQPDGGVALFRPIENIRRFNKSAERMCMPQIDEGVFLSALLELIRIDKHWVPDGDSSCLYIRPFMVATEAHVGVRPSEQYRFMIMTCPVGAYYKGNVRVKVETFFTRAAPGGTGYAKAAGNYAASLKPAAMARDQGYDQILWTDAVEHKYIEESGTMNVMFVLNGKVVSPSLGDTVLSGITRDSVLKIAASKGLDIEERKISVSELKAAVESGALTEAFGVGTAATMTPIESIGFPEGDLSLPPVNTWEVMPMLAHRLDDLRRGKGDDPFGWRVLL